MRKRVAVGGFCVGQTRQGADAMHREARTVVQRANGYGYQPVANMDATGTPPKQRTQARSALSLPTLKGGVSREK